MDICCCASVYQRIFEERISLQKKSAAVAQHTNGVRQVLRADGMETKVASGWWCSFVLCIRSVQHDYDQQSHVITFSCCVYMVPAVNDER